MGLKGFKWQFLAIPMLNDEEIDNKITDIKIWSYFFFYTEVSGLNLKFKYVVNLNSNAIYNRHNL